MNRPAWDDQFRETDGERNARLRAKRNKGKIMITARMPCYPGERGSYTFFHNINDPLDAPLRGMNFVCRGCTQVTAVRFVGKDYEDGLYHWDGNRDKPTITPSLIHRGCGWHGYLTCGQWIDFDDSVQCDSCGTVVSRDRIAKVIAFGMETNACDVCREHDPYGRR